MDDGMEIKSSLQGITSAFVQDCLFVLFCVCIETTMRISLKVNLSPVLVTQIYYKGCIAVLLVLLLSWIYSSIKKKITDYVCLYMIQS